MLGFCSTCATYSAELDVHQETCPKCRGVKRKNDEEELLE